jgi:membrane protein YqaA with SNARE-associated domain
LFRHLTDVLVAWGPLGILLLAVLDSSGVPVAGVFDALLILIAVKRPEVAWLCAGLAVLGSTVGNTVLYWMAHKGGRRFMENAAPGGRALKFQMWFRRYGMVTVFVPALVPIPMPLKLFVISAGVLGTSRSEFIGVVLLARFLRYFGEAWLGIRLGQDSSKFITSHGLDFLAGAVLLALALYAFILWRDRRVPNDHPL